VFFAQVSGLGGVYPELIEGNRRPSGYEPSRISLQAQRSDDMHYSELRSDGRLKQRMFYNEGEVHMASRVALATRLEPLKIYNGTLIVRNTISELTETCSIE
jgi:hypothetical protein